MNKSINKREPNFMSSETELLTTLVKKYSLVLENKKTDVTNNLLKEETWKKLAEDFNSSSGLCQRNSKTLRAKYENLKKTLKKKYGQHRRSLYGTGGGPPQDLNLTQEEEVILELAGPSVEGLPARFDGDMIPKSPDTLAQESAKIENIYIGDDDGVSINVEDGSNEDRIKATATPELYMENITPHRFLLKKKRSSPLINRNPDAFNKTMGNYSDLSKKKQDLVNAQIRSVEEKRKQEKKEHELRCIQLEEKAKQDAREHELRCQLMILEISFKEKTLKH